MDEKVRWTHVASYQRCAGYPKGQRCDFIFEFKGGCSPGCPCYCADCSKRLKIIQHPIIRIDSNET